LRADQDHNRTVADGGEVGAAVAAGHGRQGKARMFFFEKKNQKTFVGAARRGV
jgi:hypothetical protein